MNSVSVKKCWNVSLMMLLILFSSCDDGSTSPAKTMDKISVNLDFNFGVTGSVTLTLRETESSDELGTATISIEGFEDVEDGWKDFIFSTPVKIIEGRTYQIELERSSSNVPYQDVVLWRSGTGDVYAHGGYSSTGSSGPVGDFAFKTYIDGIVDQQQESINEVNIMDNDQILIQEFIPGKE